MKEFVKPIIPDWGILRMLARNSAYLQPSELQERIIEHYSDFNPHIDEVENSLEFLSHYNFVDTLIPPTNCRKVTRYCVCETYIDMIMELDISRDVDDYAKMNEVAIELFDKLIAAREAMNRNNPISAEEQLGQEIDSIIEKGK